MAQFNGNDFKKEYGILRFSVEELIAHSGNVVSSVQDYMGGIVSQAHTSQYLGYLSRAGNSPMSKEDYFRAYPDAFHQVSQQPSELSFLGAGLRAHGYSGGLYDQVGQARTIGDIQEILHSSVLSGMLASAKDYSGGHGGDFSNTLMASFAGYLEDAWRYDPSRGSYAGFAQGRSFFGSRKWNDQETSYSQARGSSLEGIMAANENADQGMGGAFMGHGFERPPVQPRNTDLAFSKWLRTTGKEPVFYENSTWRMNAYSGYGNDAGIMYAPEPQPGSPAALAGIQKGDRMYGFSYLSEQEVWDAADMAESGAPITMRVGNRMMTLHGNFSPQAQHNPSPTPQMPFWENIAANMGNQGSFNTGLFSVGGQSIVNGSVSPMYTRQEISLLSPLVRRGFQPVFMNSDQVRQAGALYDNTRARFSTGALQDRAQAYLDTSEGDLRNLDRARQAINTIGGQVSGVGNPSGLRDRSRWAIGAPLTIEDFNDQMTSMNRVYDDPGTPWQLHETRIPTNFSFRLDRPYGKDMSTFILGGLGPEPTVTYAGQSGQLHQPMYDRLQSPAEVNPQDPNNQLFEGVGMVRNRMTGRLSPLAQSDRWLGDPASDPFAGDPEAALNSPRIAAPGGSKARFIQDASARRFANAAGWGTSGVNYAWGKKLGDWQRLDPQIAAQAAYDQAHPDITDPSAPDQLTSNALAAMRDAAYNAALAPIGNTSLSARIALAGNAAGWRGFSVAGVVTSAEDQASKAAQRNVIQGGWKMGKDGQWERRYDVNSVEGGQRALTQALSDIGNIDPNLAARIRYGTDQEGFAQSVNQIAGNYNLPISVTPGKDAEFAQQYEALLQSNPEAAQYLSALFPNQLEQRQRATAELAWAKQAQKPSLMTGKPWEMTFEQWNEANPSGTKGQYIAMLANSAKDPGRSIPANIREGAVAMSSDLASDPVALRNLGTLMIESTPAPNPGHRVAVPGGRSAQAYMPMDGIMGDPLQQSLGMRRGRASSETISGPVSVRRADPGGGGTPPASPPGGGGQPPNDDDYWSHVFGGDPSNEEGSNTPPSNNGSGVGNTPPAAVNRSQLRGSLLANPIFRNVPRREWGARAAAAFANRTAAVGYDNGLYGKVESYRDANGETHMALMAGDYTVDRTDGTGISGGIQRMGDTEFAKAERWAQEALSGSTEGPMPRDPNDAIATKRQRVYKSLEESMNAEIDRLSTRGMPKEDAKNAAKVIQSVSEKILERAGKLVEDQIMSVGENDVRENVSHYSGNTAKRAGVYVNNSDAIQALLDRNPRIAAKVAEAGASAGAQLTAETLANLPAGQELVLGDEESGSSYIFGGGGGGGNNNRRSPFNLFGSKMGVGGALYGMYMIGREWKMAMGQSMSDATMYGKWASGGFNQSLFGNGDRGAVLSSAAGFEQRQAEGRRYLGRGAYEEFGAFMDIPYMMSGGNGASARLASGVGAGIGVGGGMFLGMNMIGGMIPALGGLAAAAPAVAGGAALTLALGTAGMEAYNAIAQPDVPLSWSGALKGAVNASNVASAKKAYKDAKIGDRIGTMTMDQVTAIEQEAEKPENFTPYMNLQARIAGGWGYDGTNADRTQAAMARFSQAGVGDSEALKAISVFQGSYGRNMRNADIDALNEWAGQLGYTVDDAQKELVSYAGQLGQLPGTMGFRGAARRFMSAKTPEEIAKQQAYASRVAGMGSQLQALMPASPEFEGFGARLVDTYKMTPTQVSSVQRLAQDAQQGGANLTWGDYARMASIGSTMTPYQSQMIGGMATQVGIAGGSSVNFISAMSGMGMSNNQLGLMDKIAGGDMGAMSWGSWQTGDMKYRFNDQAGNSIFDTNGGMGLQMMAKWGSDHRYGSIMPAAAQKVAGAGGNMNQMASALGLKNSGLQNAFIKGGWRGMDAWMTQRSLEQQATQAGIQAQGIYLQQAFYWGSGSWDNPAEGSMWNLEDRMISLQDSSRMADFAQQKRSMEMSNRYSIARENNQYQRMTTSQEYNQWTMQDNRASALRQRTWTQQDWQYQDQTRALSFGWQMEDYDENIRYASGRDRRNLIKQRDRAVISQNLEGMQIDKTRDRQEEVWKKEDERFEKQKEYQETLNRLDKESFDLNKSQREETFRMDKENLARKMKEYAEERAIREEMQKLQRKFQKDQMDLQLASLGAQAAYAKEQAEINKQLAEAQNTVGDIAGTISNLSKYDDAFNTLNALNYALATASNTKTENIVLLKDIFRTINDIPTSKLQMWQLIFSGT